MNKMLLNIFIITTIITVMILGCGKDFSVPIREPYVISDVDKITSVAHHNEIRAAVGVYNKLVWDDKIAIDAQTYADKIALSGVWGHDPDNDKSKLYDEDYGENLYTCTAYDDNLLTKASKVWAAEKPYYTYGPIGDASTCVRGQMCGHYTQQVWANTSRMGCGVNIYKRGDKKGWYIIVCKYATPGNYYTEYPY